MSKAKKPIEEEQKIPIELHTGNGKTFINFGDYKAGNDVCCELKNGQILIKIKGIRKKQIITFQQFINLVKSSSNGENKAS